MSLNHMHISNTTRNSLYYASVTPLRIWYTQRCDWGIILNTSKNCLYLYINTSERCPGAWTPFLQGLLYPVPCRLDLDIATHVFAPFLVPGKKVFLPWIWWMRSPKEKKILRGQWHKDVTPFWPFWEKVVYVSLSYVSPAIDFNGVLGGVKSLCFLESPHFSEHFDIKYSFWQNMELRPCVTEPLIWGKSECLLERLPYKHSFKKKKFPGSLAHIQCTCRYPYTVSLKP